jgi:hypothetical protein
MFLRTFLNDGVNMKFSRVAVLFLSLCFFLGGRTFAQTGGATGQVQYILTYGNGMVLVTGLYFSGATCSNSSGFVIYADNPNFKQLLSTVLMAKAMGATLSVAAKTDNCWYPEITQDSTTFISINP